MICNETGIVKVLSTNEGPTMVGSALTISTTPTKACDIFNNMEYERAEKLMKKIENTPHKSVLEFAVFDIAFEDVSMVTELFLIGHRLASFCIKSRRYVNFSDMGAIIPKCDGTEAHASERDVYIKKHVDYLFDSYNKLIEKGYKPEDARLILPLGLKSNIYMQMNLTQINELIGDMYRSKIPEIIKYATELDIEINLYVTFKFDWDYGNTMSVIEEMLYEHRDVGCNARMLRKEDFQTIPDLTIHAMGGMEKFNLLDESGFDTNDTAYNPSETPAMTTAIALSIMYGLEFLELDDQEFYDLLKTSFKHSRIMELFDGPTVGRYYVYDISYSGLTHLLRHRMQTVIAPKLWCAGTYTHGHLMYDNPDFKPIIETNKTVLESLSVMGMDGSALIYLQLCGHRTQIIQKVNDRSLYHIAELRICDRAQTEIRNIITEICKLRDEEIYETLGSGIDKKSTFVPMCVDGSCKEGKFNCGKGKKSRCADGITLDR